MEMDSRLIKPPKALFVSKVNQVNEKVEFTQGSFLKHV